MNNAVKEKRTSISIKMSKEENDIITQAAKNHGESVSGYARRVLMESAASPIHTGKDVMQTILGISYDLRLLTWENHQEVIPQINAKGAYICQCLSTR